MNRRKALSTYSLAMFGLIAPGSTHARDRYSYTLNDHQPGKVSQHFPNIEPEIIAEVVGKSHFDLNRVKELVDKRPELSRAVWEWRFGDFESAIGAASHVGRRDIALYLMDKGARPTIFTFAMLGHFKVIKSVIESSPGIQKVTGPHGISLLDHAYAGERMKKIMTKPEIENLEQTIDYLKALGDAGGEKYIDLSPEEQEKYLGDYSYGSGEKEGFSIKLNMRNILSLGPVGESGGALYKIEHNKFIYNGAPSVEITFEIQDDKVYSMTISDPGITITAEKVS